MKEFLSHLVSCNKYYPIALVFLVSGWSVISLAIGDWDWHLLTVLSLGLFWFVQFFAVVVWFDKEWK